MWPVLVSVLQEVGYQHGKTLFDVWIRSGVVDKMLKDRHQEEFHNTKTNSIVSRIEPVKPALVDEESDYQTDYEEEAVGSALSDMELSNHHGDHAEGEETADTDEEMELRYRRRGSQLSNVSP
ncbi:hypothetical protein ANANG_G00316640 [Anguilla anguilla]|uniref:Uncharacterized protein n=1 Tax=Anguilla anguilla TaxID=7936 RepID=A0A9D3LP48_ANGAN|nr:hypothetical protein ANANG_G00316640 [Anguilla anguilla]